MATKNWRRRLPAAFLCLGLWGLAGSFESASQPAGLARGYLVTSASAGRDAALAQAGGEFRIVAANLLWSRVVDHYHHQFMATGGDWSKNESLLPLLQAIITLDPHFVEAYEIMGGKILPCTGRRAEGEAVLEAGIRANPDEYELYREKAMLLSFTEHRPADALPYAEQGLARARDDFSRNLMTRLVGTLRRDIQDGAAKDGAAKGGVARVGAAATSPPSPAPPPGPARAASPGSPPPAG